MKKEFIPKLVILYIALLSIFIRGYVFGLGDQLINLPLVFKVQDPSLYTNDYLLSTQQGELTFFYQIVGKLTNYLGNTQSTTFLLYILCICAFFFIIAALSKQLNDKGLVWLVSILFFISPYHIGGSAIMTVESTLVPRTIGHVLSLFVLYFIFKRNYYISFLILGLEMLIHPLSALYIGIILYSHLIIVEKNNRVKYILIGSLTLLIISLPLGGKVLSQLAYEQGLSDMSWLKVLRLRNHYAFLDLWQIRGWLSLLLGVLPLFFYIFITKFIKKRRFYKDQLMINILATSFIILLVQFLFTVVYPVPQIIKLQLGRIWFLAITLSFICLGYFFDKLRQSINIIERDFITAVLLILTVLAMLRFPDTIKGQSNKWKETQLWALKKTDKSCIFLVPFYSEGFRIFSHRATTGEYKDGTLSFYSKQFANNWIMRLEDLNNWDRLSLSGLEKLQDKYNFSFLVSDNYSNDNLEIAFQNEKFRVYKMPSLERDCKVYY